MAIANESSDQNEQQQQTKGQVQSVTPDLNNNTATSTITTKPEDGNSYDKMQQLNDEIKKDFQEIKPEDLIRGTTPEGIELKCLEFCRTYIGGRWKKVTEADVEVTRITGGLTNQLYKVAIKDGADGESGDETVNDPRQVAIKLYQAKHFQNITTERAIERLSDTIVLTILSQVGIGPKVYGIFANGFIQSFCKHEQFRPKHQKNPELVKQLAEILAKCHHLSVPLPKKRDQFIEMMRGKMEQGYECMDLQALAKKYSVDIFLKRDIREEFEEFCSILEECDSPMVFTHYDFRGSNILVTNPDNEDGKGEKLLICDFEYSAYGPRGFDLGSIMLEWDKELFEFSFKLPKEEAMEEFVRYYVESCERLMPGYSKLPKNSVKQIMKEAKVFLLANYMFFIVFMFAPIENDDFPDAMKFKNGDEQKFKFLSLSFHNYFSIKKMLVEDGTLSKELFLE